MTSSNPQFTAIRDWLAAMPAPDSLTEYASFLMVHRQPQQPFTNTQWDRFAAQVREATVAAWMVQLIKEVGDPAFDTTRSIAVQFQPGPGVDVGTPDERETQELYPLVDCPHCGHTVMFMCDHCGADWTVAAGWGEPAIDPDGMEYDMDEGQYFKDGVPVEIDEYAIDEDQIFQIDPDETPTGVDGFPVDMPDDIKRWLTSDRTE